MRLARALAAASFIWIALLAVASACPAGGAAWACEIVFRFCSYICHQQPDRSFHWGDGAWPVCARCLGLYAAAPAGALLAFVPSASLRPGRNVFLLCVAAIPTVLTWLAEHFFGVPVSNGVRFAAALPLGGAVAWLLVYTLQDARRGQVR